MHDASARGDLRVAEFQNHACTHMRGNGLWLLVIPHVLRLIYGRSICFNMAHNSRTPQRKGPERPAEAAKRGKSVGRGPVNGRPKPVNVEHLNKLWWNGQCSHMNTVLTPRGLRAVLSCSDCGHFMELEIRLGRPKTFTVYGSDGRLVGSAPLADAGDFLRSTGFEYSPDTNSIDYGGITSGMRRKVVLLSTLEASAPLEPPEPPGDFGAAWRGMGCRHDDAECMLINGALELSCNDCDAIAMFDTVGGMFDVSISREGQDENAKYGRHGGDAVVDMIRKSTHKLFIPRRLADRMADDPDRVARLTVGTMRLLERYGLVSRIESDPSGLFGTMLKSLSAALHTRREFVKNAKSMAAVIRSGSVGLADNGRKIGARYATEMAWLSWPFWFDGVGVDVLPYDPDGMFGYCVRCGLSTLGNPNMGPGSWRHGCPECGYEGYLIDLDGRRAAPVRLGAA